MAGLAVALLSKQPRAGRDIGRIRHLRVGDRSEKQCRYCRDNHWEALFERVAQRIPHAPADLPGRS
jgi:hypothetical protein